MKSEAEIYEAVARGWCHDANSAKEMDVLLGEAIAIEVLKVIRPLVAERDALAAENVQLRAFAQWVAAGEPSPAEYDPSADGRDEALSSGNSGDSELYGVLTVYYNMAQKAKAALSLQPPTVSPSAPAVSGDSEPKP